MVSRILLLLSFLSSYQAALAQTVATTSEGLDSSALLTPVAPPSIEIDGQELSMMITEEGDTLLIATELADVSISSPRAFANSDEAKLYRKYRYYANQVYPYAVQAIRIFRETEEVTATMPKRQAKRHIRRLQKELKKEFEDPLKKLTKTGGLLLTKMIERDTGRPMHELIKELRGGLTATYWTTLGKTQGYQLKDGYIEGDNPILDIVLQDYNVSHEVLTVER